MTGLMFFQKSLQPCTLDVGSFSIGRVNFKNIKRISSYLERIFEKDMQVEFLSKILIFH